MPSPADLFLPPPPGYLDAAATAPRLRAALDAERAFYASANANPRRGLHAPAQAATRAFEDARNTVAAFLGLPPSGVVFTSGATASLNLLATGLPPDLVPPGSDLFVSVAEHHANYLPWQRAADRLRARFRVLPLTPSGDLSPDLLDATLAASPRPALVALTAMSNVLGRPQPVPALADVASHHRALLVLDVSQAVAHLPPSTWRTAWGDSWDFLAFSGHKLGAPMGIGVLAGRPDLLERLDPLFHGGEMVVEVPPDAPPVLAPLPDRLEGGTPNAAGAVALAAALRALDALPPSAHAAVAAL
ncbi:MAG: aminotransferase class V-fold PLP-dependent enzyme, partial [Kiritimatiellae bacterium]|nr:aminotransferase class V-fold PLP-dependent enzyme [Kiritimatiellia bacterium]